MMRQQVAAFAGLMERKLQQNDHKGGWTNESIEYLFDRLKQEVGELQKELKGEISGGAKPTNAELASLEAVDVANFAMMIVDKLTGGKLSSLPGNLAALEKRTKPAVNQTDGGHWYRWLVVCQGEDARVMSGKVFAVTDDKAMVAVREAAVGDRVGRPFEITIARLYRVDDEVIQKTNEVTT